MSGNVYRVMFGSLSRYVRADNLAHARAIACNAWRRVATRISAIDAVGNYAPQSLGAKGYDSAIASESREVSARQRATRKAQRKAYRSQVNAQRAARESVDVSQVFATL